MRKKPAMFWQRARSKKVDAYVVRIHQMMLFATALAGKTKGEVIAALRNDLKIEIADVSDPEGRVWSDSTTKDLSVSFTLDFKNPGKVDQVQIIGHEAIDNLMVCVNNLEQPEPHRVNFAVDLLANTRPVPKLSRLIAERFWRHPDFECEDFGSTKILMRKK